MKRIICSTILLYVFSITFAQNIESYHPKVLIGFFSCPKSVNSEQVVLIRNGYVKSVASNSRIECYNLERELNIKAVRLIDDKSESKKKLVSEVITHVNADFLIEGIVTSLDVVSDTDSQGKKGYTGSVLYTIKVLDVKRNTIAYSETKKHDTVLCDTKERVMALLADYLELSCETAMVIAPLKGDMLDVDYSVKDDKMETCYINLGLIHGVNKGDYFEVKKPRYIAGRIVYSSIGRIKVKEVVDASKSLCKLTDKEKEIYDAMKEYVKMKTLGVENAMAPIVVLMCKKGLFQL